MNTGDGGQAAAHTFFDAVLIHKGDLESMLEHGSQAVEMGEAIIGDVIAAYHGALSPTGAARKGGDAVGFAVEIDELPEDLDARLEGNDEGNYAAL